MYIYIYIYIYVSIYIYIAHVKSRCVEPSGVTLKSEVPHSRTLQQPYALGPVVILGGVGVSYDRGTPVGCNTKPSI